MSEWNVGIGGTLRKKKTLNGKSLFTIIFFVMKCEFIDDIMRMVEQRSQFDNFELHMWSYVPEQYEG